MRDPVQGDRRLPGAVLELLRDGLEGDRPRDFAVALWDGSRLEAETEPRFTVRVVRPQALAALRHSGDDLALGEAYIHGDVDVEGDLEAVFATGRRLAAQAGRSLAERARLGARLVRLSAPRRDAGGRAARLRGRRSSIARDRDAVTFHYDRSNEFYDLFLDRRMVYSAAEFAAGDDDLDHAQERKLETICHDLDLRADDRLLDIGCGWGALEIAAAGHHGARPLGITLSEPQAQLARRRIAAAGLDERCRIEVRDYRRLNQGTFDKVASIGMIEHVAPARLGDYFGRAFAALRPGGLMLNRGIVTNTPDAVRSRFIQRYVFPDTELVTLPAVLAAAAQAGFEVRSVRSLREHYAQTLRHWVRRLEEHHDAAVAAAGEVTYRIWRLYMAGSADAFESNRLSLFQTVLAKPEG